MGQVIAGLYEIREELGSGGGGVEYKDGEVKTGSGYVEGVKSYVYSAGV